jgi:flagellar assembly protein FliH
MRLSLQALSGGGGGFSRDRRFARDTVRGASDPVDAIEPEDPVALAFAEGYARGAEDARNAALSEMASADAARYRIESALATMDADALNAFEQRLRECVLGLCESVIAPAAIDPDALAKRVTIAAAMFARATDERIIRLHPEDLALVHARLPEEWHCEPDSGLERGSVRVETQGGGVEDGPAQWRMAFDEALRQC